MLMQFENKVLKSWMRRKKRRKIEEKEKEEEKML